MAAVLTDAERRRELGRCRVIRGLVGLEGDLGARATLAAGVATVTPRVSSEADVGVGGGTELEAGVEAVRPGARVLAGRSGPGRTDPEREKTSSSTATSNSELPMGVGCGPSDPREPL
jgi:hypothetical protein